MRKAYKTKLHICSMSKDGGVVSFSSTCSFFKSKYLNRTFI